LQLWLWGGYRGVS